MYYVQKEKYYLFFLPYRQRGEPIISIRKTIFLFCFIFAGEIDNNFPRKKKKKRK